MKFFGVFAGVLALTVSLLVVSIAQVEDGGSLEQAETQLTDAIGEESVAPQADVTASADATPESAPADDTTVEAVAPAGEVTPEPEVSAGDVAPAGDTDQLVVTDEAVPDAEPPAEGVTAGAEVAADTAVPVENAGAATDGTADAVAVAAPDAASPEPAGGVATGEPAAETVAPADTEVAASDLGPDEELPLDTLPPEAVQISDQERVLIEAREMQALRDLELGQKALSYKAYETALGHFLSADQNLSSRVATTQARQKALEGAMICEYYIALDKMNAGDLTGDKGALAFAKRAYGRNRKFAAAQRLVDRIEFRIAERDAIAAREARIRTKSEDYIGKKKSVEKWIDSALQHMRANEYSEAEAKLKMVLAVDEYNESAISLLKQVQGIKSRIKASEREVSINESMATVTAGWNARDYANYGEFESRGGVAESPRKFGSGDDLTRKMESIMIPEISFREANIRDVMDYLQNVSRQVDPEQDPTKKGVNFILNLPEEGSAKTITFAARYVSLMEAVKIVSEVAGVRYRVERNVVIVVPFDQPETELITRFYAVDPSVIRLISAARAAGGEEGGEESPFEAGGGLEANIEGATTDLKPAAEGMGVRFPVGSRLFYTPGNSKIVHYNTEVNLATFERILEEYNVVNPQVEIETRFVDIGQTDLDEIGFEWRLLDNYEFLQQKGNAALPASARPRVVVNQNDGSGGFTKGLRFGTLANAENPSAQLAGEAGAQFAVQSVLTNPELLMLVRAIEQSGHADLLSAPKVTTQPGEEATVKVTTEYIYPTEYRVEGGAEGVAGVVIPASFETREVGVILTVRPEISPDRQIITLTLSPDVVTDPVWRDYGYVVYGQYVAMAMPFFHRRTATTTVRVFDGATVVMGGMITEDLKSTDDRIPLLGHIPLVGRLFRSQQKLSDKRNLMIFVTAKLVDAAGRPFKKPTKPSFLDEPVSVSVATP